MVGWGKRPFFNTSRRDEAIRHTLCYEETSLAPRLKQKYCCSVKTGLDKKYKIYTLYSIPSNNPIEQMIDTLDT